MLGRFWICKEMYITVVLLRSVLTFGVPNVDLGPSLTYE